MEGFHWRAPDAAAAAAAAGSAAEVLRVLAKLPQLQSVDLLNQFLTGTLPPDVAFPALQVLQLAENFISVRPLLCPPARSLAAEQLCSRVAMKCAHAHVLAVAEAVRMG